MLRRSGAGARRSLLGLVAVAVFSSWGGGQAAPGAAPPWVGKWVGPGTILDLETGKGERFQSKFGAVEAGALSPDGTLLALDAASSPRNHEPHSIEIVDRQKGTRQTIMRIDDGAAVEWSPDGRYLFAWALQLKGAWIIRRSDRTIWSVPGSYARWGESCKSLTLVEPELGREGRGAGVLNLFEYGADQSRRLWRKVGAGIAAFVLSPDARQVAFTGQEADVWVRKVAGGPPRRLSVTPRRGERVKFWSPDSRWIVAFVVESVGDPGHFEAWDAVTGKKHVPSISPSEATDLSLWHQVQWWVPGPPTELDCSAAVQQTVGSGAGTALDADGYPAHGRWAP